VKNNLQTISSLLRLQGRRLTSTEAKAAVAESVRRIRTIALVHETLSREPGDDVAFLEIVRPLLRLAEEGLQSADRPMRFSVQGDGGRLPSTIATRFQGTAQAFQESLQGLGLILIMAIIVIYIVLGVLYESFTHPLTILSGLPSAGLGALLTLMIFRTELSLYAFVGVIMLVGLVKKNGIMMVDFAVEAQREHARTPREAIHEACLVRFRPIMMTTMAALVGTLPIALGLGAGAESRRPLGLAVVGGLLVSQFLTLYITPVYYVYIEGARQRLMSRRAKAPSGVALPQLETERRSA